MVMRRGVKVGDVVRVGVEQKGVWFGTVISAKRPDRRGVLFLIRRKCGSEYWVIDKYVRKAEQISGKST